MPHSILGDSVIPTNLTVCAHSYRAPRIVLLFLLAQLGAAASHFPFRDACPNAVTELSFVSRSCSHHCIASDCRARSTFALQLRHTALHTGVSFGNLSLQLAHPKQYRPRSHSKPA